MTRKVIPLEESLEEKLASAHLPGKHSSLEFASRGIELATSSGFDLSKFSLGLPFYGRHTSSGEPKTYYEIHDMLQQRTQVERKGKRKASSDDPVRTESSAA